MKRAQSKKDLSAEMLPEYDFKEKKGVRGKSYRDYPKGRQVRAHQEAGTVAVKPDDVRESRSDSDTTR